MYQKYNINDIIESTAFVFTFYKFDKSSDDDRKNKGESTQTYINNLFEILKNNKINILKKDLQEKTIFIDGNFHIKIDKNLPFEIDERNKFDDAINKIIDLAYRKKSVVIMCESV